MFYVGLIIGLIVGGALGAGGVYLYKVRGKVILQAKDFQAQIEAKAKELIEKAKDVVK